VGRVSAHFSNGRSADGCDLGTASDHSLGTGRRGASTWDPRDTLRSRALMRELIHLNAQDAVALAGTPAGCLR